MSKDILWVQVGSTGGAIGEEELRRIRDIMAEEIDDDEYHTFIVGEKVELFDLDTLKEHVEEIERLVEGA